MITKTAAIVLRHVPVANTSKIVSWLTPEHGRIATMIKGALRPKSQFLGQFDTFYTCELLYYDRSNRDLYITRECSPIKPRAELRAHWPACAAASYVTDLISRISPVGAPEPFLFRLLDQALDELALRGATLSHLYWEELNILAHLGLAPRLNHCMKCHTDLAGQRGPVYFIHERGGLLCKTCAQADGHAQVAIAPDVLAILRAWQQAPTAQAAKRIKCAPRQENVIENVLGRFLRYHLDLALPSRDIALTILRRAHINT